MNGTADQESRYRILRLLEGNGNLSQREMSRQFGISLGKINRFIADMTKRGLVLSERTAPTAHCKVRYRYLLTPQGLKEKAELALNFLKRRMREYEKLRGEIRELEREVGNGELPAGLEDEGRELARSAPS